jgi:cellulose biosynthesis protein BcsQ
MEITLDNISISELYCNYNIYLLDLYHNSNVTVVSMRKICFHIQKGGVGKTSISGTVAAGLARRGKKTVFVDADPQGSASSWYCRESVTADLGDILSRRASLPQAVKQIAPALSMVPVIAIGGTLKQWSETELPADPKAIEFLLSDLAALGFEYAVFDCSPSFSQLERAIIAEMDEVVSPLSPEFFSMDGIEIFVAELRSIEQKYRRKIRNDKIALNLVNQSFSRHRAFQEALAQLDYRIFTIPQDAKIAECQIAHQNLYNFAPGSKAIPRFNELIAALIAG